MIQALNLSLQQFEILCDHLLKGCSLLLIGVDIIISNFLDIPYCIAGMHLLTLNMMLDAALRFTDRARTSTGDAAADLNCSEGVQTAQSVLLTIHSYYK
jgi:hypothetical protein